MSELGIEFRPFGSRAHASNHCTTVFFSIHWSGHNLVWNSVWEQDAYLSSEPVYQRCILFGMYNAESTSCTWVNCPYFQIETILHKNIDLWLLLKKTGRSVNSKPSVSWQELAGVELLLLSLNWTTLSLVFYKPHPLTITFPILNHVLSYCCLLYSFMFPIWWHKTLRIFKFMVLLYR